MKSLSIQFPGLYQFVRYGLVGAINNLLGYLIYLLVTFLWLDPKVAITIFYPVGAITAYFGHLKYSFSYAGKKRNALMRYIITYLFSYGVNYMLLFLLSDLLGFPHQAVQVLAILVVGNLLFFMLKYFVFPTKERRDDLRI
ncbi:hypothetical protein B1207_04625 [Legionella quinlivanii]|uniref:GtrA/DPMS transmembrane domain-containing protein n=1 Tax=Legionella quinlivanii TaxID=45073 RepID=A0A364LL63_9GAMM|nr:GtrA family protein [Legionella quinlivanii]RAP37462.1 hypothetical protein B1207_04625 [Legionella quinlivanii]